VRLLDSPSAGTAAARQKAYRKRRKRGLRFVRIMLGPKELDRLVDKGYLASDDTKHRFLVEDAVSLLVENALK
jgi:hypothetical protein